MTSNLILALILLLGGVLQSETERRPGHEPAHNIAVGLDTRAAQISAARLTAKGDHDRCHGSKIRGQKCGRMQNYGILQDFPHNHRQYPVRGLQTWRNLGGHPLGRKPTVSTSIFSRRHILPGSLHECLGCLEEAGNVRDHVISLKLGGGIILYPWKEVVA